MEARPLAMGLPNTGQTRRTHDGLWAGTGLEQRHSASVCVREEKETTPPLESGCLL